MLISVIHMMMDNRVRGLVITEDELVEMVQNLREFGTDVADVEAKQAAGGLPKSIRETISAFSNTLGGVLILGLDESANFAASGLANASKMSQDLASYCATEFEPPVRPLIQAHVLEGAHVVTAEVAPSDPVDRPCFYKGVGMNRGSFVRVHDGDHRMTPYEVQLMLANRGQPREDEEPVAGTTLADLDQDLVQASVARMRQSHPYAYRQLTDAEVLRRSKILVKAGDEEVASIAGLLALGSYPQQHFPQLMLTFVHYPTPDGGDLRSGERFLDNVSLEGPISAIARDALDVFRRNMARRSVVKGAGRQDTWEYPETALREAVVNALVHRDLSPMSRGAQVQVEMYPDRLVVRSPGGLFGPVSIDNLGEEGVSSSRNALLLRLLEDVPMPSSDRTVCENRGSGIKDMVNSLREAGMTLPQFHDGISRFEVTFPNHALLSDDIVAWINSLEERQLSDSQCLALVTMKSGQVVDNLSFRNLARLDSRQATSELQDLVARELVVQEGSRRWTRYRLHSRIAGSNDPAPGRRRPANRRQELLLALGDETLSRAELCESTGLSSQVVLHWLRVLRSEGMVVATEGDRLQSRNTRYRRTPLAQEVSGQAVLDLDIEM